MARFARGEGAEDVGYCWVGAESGGVEVGGGGDVGCASLGGGLRGGGHCCDFFLECAWVVVTEGGVGFTTLLTFLVFYVVLVYR